MYLQFVGAVILIAAGCGSGSERQGTDGGSGSDGGPRADAGPVPTDEELETASGCPGVYNPGQLLDYELVLDNADWQTVLGDTTNAIFVPAQLVCGDVSLAIGVRRKRSGEIAKPGLKLDINYFVPGQEYFGLRKLSLEILDKFLALLGREPFWIVGIWIAEGFGPLERTLAGTAGAFAFGTAIEVWQHVAPIGRFFDPLDLVPNWTDELEGPGPPLVVGP